MTDAEIRQYVTDALIPLYQRLEKLEHPNQGPPLPVPTPQPTPPPPVPFRDFPAGTTFLHADVSGWAVTSTVTRAFVDAKKGLVCEHTKAGKWPPLGEGEGNAWIVAQVDGRWYAATYEWLHPGQTAKLGGKIQDVGPNTKKEPLRSWHPKPGEKVGLFMSTFARDARRTTNERSNIAWVTWPK
jgi:hypothetical protein